jgi:hypothetical protein
MMVAHEQDRPESPAARSARPCCAKRSRRARLAGPSPELEAWTDYVFKVTWRILGVVAAAAALRAGEPVLHLIHGFVR